MPKSMLQQVREGFQSHGTKEERKRIIRIIKGIKSTEPQRFGKGQRELQDIALVDEILTDLIDKINS